MISDPWIRRGPRERVVREVKFPDMQLRRETLRAAGKCINGPMDGNVGSKGVVHGPVVQGGRCAHCVRVHSSKAIELSSRASAVVGDASDMAIEQAIEKALDDEERRN